jgi:hypothetical protein
MIRSQLVISSDSNCLSVSIAAWVGEEVLSISQPRHFFESLAKVGASFTEFIHSAFTASRFQVLPFRRLAEVRRFHLGAVFVIFLFL